MQKDAGNQENGFASHFNNDLGLYDESTTIIKQVYNCQHRDDVKCHDLEIRMVEKENCHEYKNCPAIEESQRQEMDLLRIL